MSDLWVEASRDLDAEMLAVRMAHAKVAAATVWPFLAMSRTGQEFEHRLAMSYSRIADVVEPEMLDSLVASLRDDYAILQPPVVEREVIRSTANMHQAAPQPMQFFDRQRGRWVTAAAQPSAQNPAANDPTPESGPFTGETGTYPVEVDGPDPWNPINGNVPMPPNQAVPPANRFPAEPQPWTSTPESAWRENPMQLHAGLNPYNPATHPVAWVHWERMAAFAFEAEGEAPVQSNPEYFAEGNEGVQSTDGGFPPDVSLPEPDERVDMYRGMTTPTDTTSQRSGQPMQASIFNHRRLADTTNFVDNNPYQDSLDQTEMPVTPPDPPASMTPGGAGAEAMTGGGGGGGSPTSTSPAATSPDPGGADAASKMGSRRRVVADGDYRGRRTPDDPTGMGDDYTALNFDKGVEQRPMTSPEQRGANTPQRAAPQIPQNSSSNAEGGEDDDEDDEDRREAVLRRYVQAVARQAAMSVRAA